MVYSNQVLVEGTILLFDNGFCNPTFWKLISKHKDLLFKAFLYQNILGRDMILKTVLRCNLDLIQSIIECIH